MADDWRFFGSSLRDVYSHLGSTCHVMLKGGKDYSGHLYNVDPETLTLLLLVQAPEDKEGKVDSQDYKTIVAIRQHAIKDFSIGMFTLSTIASRLYNIRLLLNKRIFDRIDKSPASRKITMEDMDKCVPVSASLASPESILARKAQLIELLRSVRCFPILKKADGA